MPDDRVGSSVGEYTLLRFIGRGGMGLVYEGVQPVIGKRVAVKMLLPELVSDESTVARFVAEARSVNSIQHRGIVDIFSFGRLPDGTHYFVMEYLEGALFNAIIEDRAPIAVPQVLAWALEVLDALDAAHTAHVIHRDIKPSNLYLVSSRRGPNYVKLLDFGLAKLHELGGAMLTQPDLALGTAEYMSPEQVRGDAVTPAADLYGLGCVLFEMLTGSLAFDGGTTAVTMTMHLEKVAPPPSH